MGDGRGDIDDPVAHAADVRLVVDCGVYFLGIGIIDTVTEYRFGALSPLVDMARILCVVRGVPGDRVEAG